MIIWHDHHIWPQHAIGPAPKNNLLRCNIAMHALMHKLEYEKWGRWQDKISADMLSGQITVAEATRLAQSVAGKSNKGRQHGPPSAETRRKISEAAKGRPRKPNRIRTQEEQAIVSANISKALLGIRYPNRKPQTVEHNRKIAKSMLGNKNGRGNKNRSKRGLLTTF